MSKSIGLLIILMVTLVNISFASSQSLPKTYEDCLTRCNAPCSKVTTNFNIDVDSPPADKNSKPVNKEDSAEKKNTKNCQDCLLVCQLNCPTNSQSDVHACYWHSLSNTSF